MLQQNEEEFSRFSTYKNQNKEMECDRSQAKLKELFQRQEDTYPSENSMITYKNENNNKLNDLMEKQVDKMTSNLVLVSNTSFNLNESYKKQTDKQVIKIVFKDYGVENSTKNENIFKNSSEILNQKQNQLMQQISNYDNNSKSCQMDSFISTNKGNGLQKFYQNSQRNQTCKVSIQDINKITRIRQKLLSFFTNKTLSGRKQLLKNPKIRYAFHDNCDLRDDNKNRFMNILEIIYILIKKKKSKFLSFIPLFNPQNPLLFIFQIIFSIFNYLFFILLSVLVVFHAELNQQESIFKGVAFVWIVEILIKLNTSIYISTNLIVNRDIIIGNYIKKNAIYDLIPFVALMTMTSDSNISIYFKIFSFIKIKNINEEVDDIQKQLCMALKQYYQIQLVNLIFKMFLVAHIIACMWQIVGQIEKTYLNENKESPSVIISEDNTWWKLYLESFYWSLTLMATGSNSANTSLQIFFTSLNMLVTTIIFGYLINVIGIILSSIDQQEETKRRDINIINEYMRKRNISNVKTFWVIFCVKLFADERSIQSSFQNNSISILQNRNLQRRVNLDLEYFYEKNYKKISEENEEVLGKISNNLTEQISKEYYGKIINKIGYISQFFSEDSINKLILCVEELHYIPNQILFKEDQNSDFSLMYIVEGSVELSRQVSTDSQISKTLAVLGKDCVFGQLSFFSGHVRGACAKSKSFTTILKISREKFLNIIQQNEKDYEQFCQIKDEIMIYKNFEKINIKCATCNKFNHFSSDCPFVHFDREEAYSKAGFSQKIKQARQYKERNKRKSKNSLIIQKQIQDVAIHTNNLMNKEIFEQQEEDSSNFTEDGQEKEEEQFPIVNKLINNDDQKKTKYLTDFPQTDLQEHSEIIKSFKSFLENQRSKQILTMIKDETIIATSDLNDSDIQKSQILIPENNSVLQGPELTQRMASVNYRGSIRKTELIEKDMRQSIEKRNTPRQQQILHNSDQNNSNTNKSDILWNFEKLKEYQIYFPQGIIEQ